MLAYVAQPFPFNSNNSFTPSQLQLRNQSCFAIGSYRLAAAAAFAACTCTYVSRELVEIETPPIEFRAKHTRTDHERHKDAVLRMTEHSDFMTSASVPRVLRPAGAMYLVLQLCTSS